MDVTVPVSTSHRLSTRRSGTTMWRGSRFPAAASGILGQYDPFAPDGGELLSPGRHLHQVPDAVEQRRDGAADGSRSDHADSHALQPIRARTAGPDTPSRSRV